MGCRLSLTTEVASTMAPRRPANLIYHWSAIPAVTAAQLASKLTRACDPRAYGHRQALFISCPGAPPCTPPPPDAFHASRRVRELVTMFVLDPGDPFSNSARH